METIASAAFAGRLRPKAPLLLALLPPLHCPHGLAHIIVSAIYSFGLRACEGVLKIVFIAIHPEGLVGIIIEFNEHYLKLYRPL